MANILGTLFVNVTANTADFIGGLDKASFAARKAGRDIESSFSRLGDVARSALAPLGEMGQQIATTLGSVGEAAGKAMAALGSFAAIGVGAGVAAAGLGTALVAAAVHAAELGSQIFEASEKTGLTAASLSGLMALSKETGGSFEALTTSLARATANLEKTAEGGGRANAALFRLMGGAQGAAELGLKPMDDRIQIVLKRIFDLSDAGQRNLALTQLLGRGWMENVETLKLLAGEGYGPAIAKAKEFGVYFDAEHARQAKEFQVAVAELNGELGAVALTLGSQLLPKLELWMAEAQVMPEEIKLLTIGLKAQAASMVDVFGVTDKYLSKLADQATETVTQEDTKIKAFIAHLHEVAEASKAGGVGAPAVIAGTKEHADALERAAKASAEFWEKYNAGLAEASVRLPKVVDLFKEISAYQEKLDKEAETGAWQKMVTGLATGVTPGGAAVAAAGLPAGLAPGVGPAPLAILPAEDLARRMEMIKRLPAEVPISKLRIEFMQFFDEVQARGADFSGKMLESLSRTVDGFSSELARLVVTGKSSFRQLFEGLEMEIMKAGIDRLFARIAKNVEGAAMGGGGTAGAGAAGVAGTASGVGFGGFLKGIASLFGGFRAAGGPVIPGRAYMVGERGPELFVPRQPGSVAAGASAPGHTTVLNFNVHGVSDYDSFRRSQSQIMAGLQHQLAQAYSRQQG